MHTIIDQFTSPHFLFLPKATTLNCQYKAMTSPSYLDWISWSRGSTKLNAGLGRSMSIGSCPLLPDATFKVAYLIWKVSCLNVVLACLKGVVDKLELSVKMVPLTLKVMALVVELMIAFDLCNRVPALLVHHCFVEGAVGRGQACEEIVEPGGYWLSHIWGVVWCEI